MSKKLFIEILPLSPWGNAFHEIAIIIEIDNEVKAAYHYKIKLDNQSYQSDTLERQGYSVQEIKDNPQSFYEVYGSILRLLETYVNAFDEEDFFVIYTWSKRQSSIFKEFLNGNGVRNLDQYIFKFPVLVGNLVLDRNLDLIKQGEGVSLDFFNESLGNKGIERNALNRVVAIYKLYKSFSGVSS